MPSSIRRVPASLSQQHYYLQPRSVIEHELAQTKNLVAQKRAKEATLAGTSSDKLAHEPPSESLRLHATRLQSMLDDKQNGSFYERHRESLKKVALYVAVGSELVSIPLLVINIIAMCRHKRPMFLTPESPQKKKEKIDPLITQYPLLTQANNYTMLPNPASTMNAVY